MPVEAATGIGTLVAANPLESDPVAEGNDHMQLIKAVLQAQFPPAVAGTDDAPFALNEVAALLVSLTDRITALETEAVRYGVIGTGDIATTGVIHGGQIISDADVSAAADVTGNTVSSVGAISAGTTITAQDGIESVNGGLTAGANIGATGSVNAGTDVVANGNVIANNL